MNTKNNASRILSYVSIGVIVALIVLGLLILWLYNSVIVTTTDKSAVAKIFSAVPLPVGKVGKFYVTYNNLVKTSKTSVAIDEWFPVYAQDKKIESLLEIHRVPGRKDDGAEFLPQDELKIWWAGNAKLNPRYQQMQFFERQLGEGERLGALAAQYSEDTATRSFYGDAGFVNLAEALPEFRAAVEKMDKGDYRIIPTRYGLELVWIEEVITESNGKRLVHLRHLLLRNTEYESWLADDLKKVDAKLYIKTR